MHFVIKRLLLLRLSKQTHFVRMHLLCISSKETCVHYQASALRTAQLETLALTSVSIVVSHWRHVFVKKGFI
jgi:hypothetical protein